MVPETIDKLWEIFCYAGFSLLGALTRATFQVLTPTEPTPSLRRFTALVMASAMMGVMLAVTCMEIERLKEWGKGSACWGGFFAQDLFTWLMKNRMKLGNAVATALKKK